MRIAFPLLMAIGYRADNREWLDLIGSDSAALHITAFAVESFIDRILCKQENTINLAAMIHFQKGTNIIHERLLGHDEEKKISDSTIGTVLKLASAAHFCGDFNASQHHMEGIRRMVDLRGGLTNFHGKHMCAEMSRWMIAKSLCPLWDCAKCCQVRPQYY